MDEYELQINRMAQGLISWTRGVSWFEALDSEGRSAALHAAYVCCEQAQPLPEEVNPAIEMAALKPTHTPCVMLSSANPPEHALWDISRLIPSEQMKAFKLLVALFSLADKRRRETICADGCSHEWHQISFQKTYRRFVSRYLNRTISPDDGLDDTEIQAAEDRLGLRLAAALVEYYSVAGAVADLNQVHNQLLAPEGLHVEDGYLLFMDENQSVVSWGIKLEDQSEPDPKVWQRNNTPPEEWFSEEKTFTEFLTSMFDWYEELGVWKAERS